MASISWIKKKSKEIENEIARENGSQQGNITLETKERKAREKEKGRAEGRRRGKEHERKNVQNIQSIEIIQTKMEEKEQVDDKMEEKDIVELKDERKETIPPIPTPPPSLPVTISHTTSVPLSSSPVHRLSALSAPALSHSLSLWSVDDVSEWLTNHGMSEYVLPFRKNLIDGETFMQMDQKDMKFLGVGEKEIGIMESFLRKKMMEGDGGEGKEEREKRGREKKKIEKRREKEELTKERKERRRKDEEKGGILMRRRDNRRDNDTPCTFPLSFSCYLISVPHFLSLLPPQPLSFIHFSPIISISD